MQEAANILLDHGAKPEDVDAFMKSKGKGKGWTSSEQKILDTYERWLDSDENDTDFGFGTPGPIKPTVLFPEDEKEEKAPPPPHDARFHLPHGDVPLARGRPGRSSSGGR